MQLDAVRNSGLSEMGGRLAHPAFLVVRANPLGGWTGIPSPRKGGNVSYKESVLERIESREARQEERKNLWTDVSTAYEDGGIEEVESALTKRMQDLGVEFRHLLEKLERML